MKDGAHFHVAMHKPAGRPCVVDAGDVSVESPLHLRPIVVHRGVPFGARVIRTHHPGLHVGVRTHPRKLISIQSRRHQQKGKTKLQQKGTHVANFASKNLPT